jgi:hypothetical protein
LPLKSRETLLDKSGDVKLSFAEMPFSENTAWSYRVHERLGEELHYYVVNVRPYVRKKIVSEFEHIIEQHKLGSVRVFPIFGRHDLIVRAWLHPNVAHNFHQWVREGVEGFVAAHELRVTNYLYRWSSGPCDPHRATMLVRQLTEQTIRAVQGGGKNDKALEDLRKQGLVLDLGSVSRITFFVALFWPVSLLDSAVTTRLLSYLIAHPSLERVTVDIGIGFCSMLCKGQVELSNYFEISNFVQWIGEDLGDVGVTTETFLSHESRHIAGREFIGDATFSEIRGIDLTAQALIPELYDNTSVISVDLRREIEIALTAIGSRELGDNERKLVHDYLLGVMQDDPKERAKPLGSFFMTAEYTLRDALDLCCRSFAGKAPRDLYTVAGLPEGSHGEDRLHSLGSLLRLYAAAIKASGREDLQHLAEGWQALAEARNDVVHGKKRFMTEWKHYLDVIIREVPRFRELEVVIQQLQEEKTWKAN